MKYAIVTFGCRVNQADSLKLEEDLRTRGASEAPCSEADLVIVNTCSVTATADQGARQTVRRIARENPSARIVVTGCYATRRPQDVAALPGVVRVVTNDDKLSTVSLLEDAGEVTTARRFGAGDGGCGAAIEPGVAGRTAFTLRVQTGCEERCSYCIIPATRGAGRSVPLADVVQQVERIAAAGFKEIALTGVHLGSYGRDLASAGSLADLLRALERIDGDVTFRVSSLEPMDCTPDVVDIIASHPRRFAPHLHLPLQHASDRVLRRMRRPYTLDYYRRLVDDIVTRLPHASIGSDVIAGFPGETDEDFVRNVEYLTASPLSHLHVFPYSDRPGTEAAAMNGKVDGRTTRERGAELRRIGAELSRRFREAQIGTLRPGLTLDDGTVAVTDNYLKVRIPAGRRRNERVVVRILGDGRGEVRQLLIPELAGLATIRAAGSRMHQVESLPPDIPTVLHAVEGDARHAIVGAGDGAFVGRTAADDRQHAPSGRDDRAIAFGGACMEHQHIGQC
jgi:threonylcarbamoyladenosine tRNA methylthiotransferase MtaB